MGALSAVEERVNMNLLDKTFARRAMLLAALPALLLAAPFAVRAEPSEAVARAVALDPEIDPEGLAAFESLLVETKSRSAIVWRKGQVLAEWYWLEGDPEVPVEVWSVSKSFASTAIGLLIDDGKIGSVEDPVSKYIPSWGEGEKAKVRIADLLEHTSGLKDVAGAGTPADLLQQCLGAPLVSAPGEKKIYNNAACNVLSAVISAAAGVDPEALMKERVFDPIGMSKTSWRRDDGGNVITYAGIQTTPRDLLRFGRLFLDGGVWEGERVLSREWIEAATAPRATMSIAMMDQVSEYGFLWWVDFDKETLPHNYSALGLWGNHLTVVPSLELICIRLVGNKPDGGSMMRRTKDWARAVVAIVKR